MKHSSRLLPNLVRPLRTDARRGIRSFVAVLALGASTSSCKELEVFPDRIQVPVASGSVEFEAYARVRKKRGKVTNDDIKWESGSVGVVHTENNGRVAILKVATTNPTSTPMVVTVSGGGKKKTLKVEVLASSGDQVTGMMDLIPSTLAVIGRAAGCPAESTYVFVEKASIGDWRANCAAEAVALSAGYGARLWSSPFTNHTEELPAASLALREIPLKIWNITPTTTAPVDCSVNPTDQMCVDRQNEVTTASAVFDHNRVGMRLKWGDNTIHNLVGSFATCDQLQYFIDPDGSGASPPLPSRFEAGSINVYLKLQGLQTDARGSRCYNPLETWQQKTVIVLESDADPTTLRHEVGHVLGLTAPWGRPPSQHLGHVDDLKGFAWDNVMFAKADLSSTAPRTRLSIGQVYRMNFDKRSAFGAASDCGCDPYKTTGCGRLSRDIGAVNNPAGSLDYDGLYCPPP